MVLGPTGNRRFGGVWAAPEPGETRPKGGARRAPPFGRGFWAAGAAKTPKVDDFRSAQKPCIKMSTVRIEVIPGPVIPETQVPLGPDTPGTAYTRNPVYFCIPGDMTI